MTSSLSTAQGASEQCKYGNTVYNLNTWCTSHERAAGCSRLCWKPYKACFRREDTTACRLTSAAADVSAAYSSCYGRKHGDGRARSAAMRAGELVRMEALRAGDHVLSVDAAGSLHADRVFINAHLDDDRATAPFLTLHYPGGALSITVGHTAWVEGRGLVSAHALSVGDGLRLRSGVRTVERITQSSGRIINPVTVSGYILAASGRGAPVRMSVVEEGGWDELLGSLGIVATPMLLLVSRVAPAQVREREGGARTRDRATPQPSQLTSGIRGADARARVPHTGALTCVCGQPPRPHGVRARRCSRWSGSSSTAWRSTCCRCSTRCHCRSSSCSPS